MLHHNKTHQRVGVTAFLATLALAPAHASAAETTVKACTPPECRGYRLHVTAAPGMENRLFVAVTAQRTEIVDTTAGVTESPDTRACEQVSATHVSCTSRELRGCLVDAGDEDDALASSILAYLFYEHVWWEVYGSGRYDEVVEALSPANDACVARGGPGDDWFNTWGPFAASGDEGNDTLLGYFDAQLLLGGPGNDVLVGSEGAQGLYGGPGRDRLRGGRGRDLCDGGGGRDVLHRSCDRRISP